MQYSNSEAKEHICHPTLFLQLFLFQNVNGILYEIRPTKEIYYLPVTVTSH